MAHEPPRNASPSNEAPVVGTTLGGRFRVVRQLGEGGMGLVLEAENILTGKRVAVKWMRPELAAKPEAVERFMREARASARVRHPNVVDVYDVVHDAGGAFLVMELLEGEPLTAVLERGGMPAHELISLLLDAMRGVAAAHKQGVIHRDVKPDNIFLAEEADRTRRTPKVLDFGISKVSDGESLSLTQTGAALGTPLYMSFEQLCGVRDIDARTDVYAFGVILYEALTGRPPFEAETFTELIIKITNTRPTPAKALRGDIPRSLDALIQAAMAKEREQRLPSLDAMIRELERFATADQFRAQMTADHAPMPKVVSPSQQPPMLLSEAAETGQADTPMSADVPAPVIPRRRDAAPWLIGGAVLVSLLGALMFFGSRGDDAPPGGRPPLVDSHGDTPADSLGARPARAATSPAPADEPSPPSAADPSAVPAVTPALPFGKAPPPSAAAGPSVAAKPNETPHPISHETHAPGPTAKPIAIKPAQVEAPRPVPIAPPKPNNTTNLRAGRPRSQDF